MTEELGTGKKGRNELKIKQANARGTCEVQGDPPSPRLRRGSPPCGAVALQTYPGQRTIKENCGFLSFVPKDGKEVLLARALDQ